MIKTVLLIGLALASSSIHANWLDDLSTDVGGHISDIKSRFADDQLIDGDILVKTTFRENDRGKDTLHHSSGGVFIVDTAEGRYLQLAPDFSSTPGPDYHAYISQDTNGDLSSWATPAAVADVILFCASDAARAVCSAAIPAYGRC